MTNFHTMFSTIDREYHEIVSNKHDLQVATEKYLNKIIDNIIIGIVLSVHRNMKLKTCKTETKPSSIDQNCRPCVDIFGSYNFKKKYECLCRNCDRIVGASGFAPHLEKCMGLGRIRSRNASKRVANNSRERESSYGGVPSDDDDDMGWSCGDKRRRKKYRNGVRKVKGNSKKIVEVENVESVNVDIEGESEEYLNMRDFSRGPSPADSVSSSGSTKRRDRPKNKKRREKHSPTSLNI